MPSRKEIQQEYSRLIKPKKMISSKYQKWVSATLLSSFDSYTRLYNDYADKKILVAMLYLSPSTSSGIKGLDLCNYAGTCKEYCFFQSSKTYQGSRNARTLWFYHKQPNFMNHLVIDIVKYIRIAKVNNLTPYIRLNGLSDVQWEKEFFQLDEKVKDLMKYYFNEVGQYYSKEYLSLKQTTLFQLFNNLEFYDYTKYPPEKRKIKHYLNYSLCYSYDTFFKEKITKRLKNDKSVAIIVNPDKNTTFKKIIDTANNDSDILFTVINGDKYDCRALDSNGKVILLEADPTASTHNNKYIIRNNTELKKLLIE